MDKVRVLNIFFNNKLRIDDLPRLRGAIVHRIGEAHIDFHNHNGDKLLYRYPLIQYKNIDNKACIVCINHGTDSIHEFLSLDDYSITLGDIKINLQLDKIVLKQYNIQIWDSYFSYRLHHWLALNEENYTKYKTLTNEDEKIFFLEKILIGNLWGFSKNLGYKLEKEIRVNILQLNKEMVKPFKGINMHAITLDFRTNLYLPPNIGLGKGVSVGFGIVAPIRKK
jgi:hypothetical protein